MSGFLSLGYLLPELWRTLFARWVKFATSFCLPYILPTQFNTHGFNRCRVNLIKDKFDLNSSEIFFFLLFEIKQKSNKNHRFLKDNIITTNVFSNKTSMKL